MSGAFWRRVRFLILIYVACLPFFALRASAKDNSYTFTSIQSIDGLPQNDVHSIINDNAGFLWFATNDGLCRYDGYEFKSYRIDNSALESNAILSLCNDPLRDVIYVGTIHGGLYMFDIARQQIERIPIISDGDVRKIVVDKWHKLWVSDDDANLFMVDLDALGRVAPVKMDIRVAELLLNSNKELVAMIDNKLYITGQASKDGEFNWKLYEFQWSLMKVSEHEGVLYAIVNDALHSLSLDDCAVYRVEDIPIRNYRIMRNGEVIYSTSKGIYRGSISSNIKTTKLFGGNIWTTDLYEDIYGSLWIGTFRKGVMHYEPIDLPFESVPFNGNIESVFEDSRGTLWAGSTDGGLAYRKAGAERFTTKNITWENDPFLISTIEEHPLSKRLYVGCAGGLFSADNSSVRTPNAKIYFRHEEAIKRLSIQGIVDILSDSHYLWIATYYDGIYLYDVIANELVNKLDIDNCDIPSNTIRSLYKDNQGNIWFGTDVALAMIKYDGRFSASPSLVVANVLSDSLRLHSVIPIVQAQDGSMWVGTLGKGIFKATYANGTIVQEKVYSTANGLVNNTIKGLVADDEGGIWASTNRGINRINLADGYISSFDVSDGLLDYEFCDLAIGKGAKGDIYFGSVKGLNILQSNYAINSDKPTVAITDLLLFNNSVAVGEQIEGKVILERSIEYIDQIMLRHFENSFSLKFTSMHYTSRGKHSYYYRLNGFESEWVNALEGQRIAHYTNIPAGEYHFEVKCRNSNNEWSDIKSVEINITPPIYATWYAYLFYFIAAVSAIVASMLYYRHSLLRASQMKIVRMERKHIENFANSKTELFTNISHEFRTPLTLILSPLNKMLDDSSLPEEMLRPLRKIEKNASLLLTLVNNIMDFTKSESRFSDFRIERFDIVKFCEGVTDLFGEWGSSKNVKLNLSASDRPIFVMLDKFHMRSILYNLLSNAMKHTPEGGSVDVEIDQFSDDQLTITIADSGLGIEEGDKQNIFNRFFNRSEGTDSTGVGLALTKLLVEKNGGVIEFESKVGVGTVFTLTLPINSDGVVLDNRREDNELDGSEVLSLSSGDQKDQSQESAQACVLVVDDNVDILDTISELLSPYYKVVCAKDGEEGYDLCRKSRPALVIADVMMPKVDGMELCRLIKSSASTSHIPVIMLSAKCDLETQAEGFEHNIDAFCAKPFDNKVLLSTVKSLIENRRRITERGYGVVAALGSDAPQDESDNERQFMERLIKIIEDNMSDPEFNIDCICQEMKVSQAKLSREVRRLTGLTVVHLIKSTKLERAAAMLNTGRYTVAETTYAVGFNDLRYFRESFKEKFGVLPSEVIRSMTE